MSVGRSHHLPKRQTGKASGTLMYCSGLLLFCRLLFVFFETGSGYVVLVGSQTTITM